MGACENIHPWCLWCINIEVKDCYLYLVVIIQKVDEILKNKFEQNRHISFSNIAAELNVDQRGDVSHLHKAEYKKNLDIWIPQELTGKISWTKFTSANHC